ncbi:MAG: glutathione S-transferase family protein [Alphaproteobacteria bacterium]|nr:glutathione S-transferase family protein [Alphaproteobacteria bacterium]
MGYLESGVWSEGWYDTRSTEGHFVRKDSAFRQWIGEDGPFPAAPGRYHLYVSLACPWAHRTLIVRALKRLEDVISVSVVAPVWGEGWGFYPDDGGSVDHLYGESALHKLYARADATYSGRVTVPVLWDRDSATIVNNESAEIIRMLNSAFDAWGDGTIDLYPAELREDIDAVNAKVYRAINNGVYACGFATTQSAYEQAFDRLFAALDELEARLSNARYLVGNRLTEADIRLFTTLVRFDSVYVGHFKCNKRRLVDYPNLWAFTRDLYHTPGIAPTVDMDHIKRHYYICHDSINPNGIVPKGPELNFALPHGREGLGDD